MVVIDQDQGRSGASRTGRDGFEYLIAEVGLGRAGAVLCLEASRLARSSSDWYRLIEICALTDTLVIDEDGVYDPGQGRVADVHFGLATLQDLGGVTAETKARNESHGALLLKQTAAWHTWG